MSSVPHLPWSLFGRLIQISSNRSQNHFDRRPLCTPLYSPVCLLRLLPGHPPPEPLQAPHSIRSRISISAVSVSPVYPSRQALTRVHYVTLHPRTWRSCPIRSRPLSPTSRTSPCHVLLYRPTRERVHSFPPFRSLCRAVSSIIHPLRRSAQVQCLDLLTLTNTQSCDLPQERRSGASLLLETCSSVSPLSLPMLASIRPHACQRPLPMSISPLNLPIVAALPSCDFFHFGFLHHIDSYPSSPALCRSAILVVILLSSMPTAQGRVLPLEIPRRTSPNLPSFVDSTATARGRRIGSRRQVSGSSSNRDTASISITPSSAGLGEEWTITETTTKTETISEVCVVLVLQVFFLLTLFDTV